MADSIPTKGPHGLTAKQKRFAEEFAADPNATQAYFKAFGRTTKDGKRRCYQGASKSAQRLLQKDLVKREIEAAQIDYQERCRADLVKWVKEVAGIAFFDPADAFIPDPDGGPALVRPMHDIPVATRKAIQSVKYKKRKLKGADNEDYEIEEVEYKFLDKQTALEKLAKRLNLYPDGDKSDDGDGKSVNAGLGVLARFAALLTGEQSKQLGTGSPVSEHAG